jgi:uncharacterized protein YjiS (DUF1127 family)
MELHAFSDRELRDFGMTRGEIDYVFSDSSIDARSGLDATRS